MMLIVALVFIPNPACSFWVGFSVISIELGVTGYMAFWDIALDSVSMISLIMCIGFSVDFSAHISYAYMSSSATTPDGRVIDALYQLGYPILQGALSTVVALSGFVFIPSYIFKTFLTMIVLVMLFGTFHGLFLLPVLLSLFGQFGFLKTPKDEQKYPEKFFKGSDHIFQLNNKDIELKQCNGFANSIEPTNLSDEFANNKTRNGLKLKLPALLMKLYGRSKKIDITSSVNQKYLYSSENNTPRVTYFT